MDEDWTRPEAEDGELRGARAAADEAVTAPFAVGHLRPAPPAKRRGPRKRRARRTVMTLGALAALLAIGGALLLQAHAARWGFFALGATPQTTPTWTAEPTWTPGFTPEPIWTPTRPPTATATKGSPPPPPPPPPSVPLDLGCGPGASHAPGYVIKWGQTSPKMAALTFDDGPNPTDTPNILSTLEQTHTPATFFVMGMYTQRYPWLVQREAADGVVGIHTWDHPAMTTLSPSARQWEIASTADIIHKALGANYCIPLWRPPYGDYNGAVLAQAQGMGLTTILWNVDPADWSTPGTDVIVNRVMQQVQPGSIILMHDGPSYRQQTVAALPIIIKNLRSQGYQLVTVPDLLRGGPAPTATPKPSPTATATATATPTATDTPTTP